MKRRRLPDTLAIRKPTAILSMSQRFSLVYPGCFFLLMIASAIVYWIAARYGTSLQFTYTESASPTFWDCVYFSIVTITSLGYGDVRPVGFYRFVAGAEVLLGLMIVGLWISALASRRTELLLERMHGHTIDERFKGFRGNIRRLTHEFCGLVQAGDTSQSSRLYSTGSSTNGVLDELFAVIDGAVRYLRYEIQSRQFFSTTGPRPFGRLLGVLIATTQQLRACAVDVKLDLASDSRHVGNRERLEEILQRIEVIARCAAEHSPHDEHKRSAESLQTAIEDFFAPYREANLP